VTTPHKTKTSLLPYDFFCLLLTSVCISLELLTQRILSLFLFRLSLMLRPTVSWPICLGIKHPTGAYDQICVSVRQLRGFSCGALSLTRGRVCRLQLLLAPANAVILGYESRGARDHILLSQIRDFPFHRLLRLAGSRWRYSTPPLHGGCFVLCYDRRSVGQSVLE
jgi:hypothetical protein